MLLLRVRGPLVQSVAADRRPTQSRCLHGNRGLPGRVQRPRRRTGQPGARAGHRHRRGDAGPDRDDVARRRRRERRPPVRGTERPAARGRPRRRAGSARFVPDTEYVEDSDGYPDSLFGPFSEHEYLRYDGRYYEIEISCGRLYNSYGIEAASASPDGSVAVVPVEELPGSVREEVRAAVETGRYHAPMGKWDTLPEPLGDTAYVGYENETYWLTYSVGDYWAPVLELRPVDDRPATGRTSSAPSVTEVDAYVDP